MFLCYDIKGIQQFIFSVPRLKCVIGASELVSEFDRWAGEREGKIFAGGGRGVFSCRDAAMATALEQALIDQAASLGLDLRIGLDDNLTQAFERPDRLYPYTEVDDTGRGEPCAMSGLWPVAPGEGCGPKGDIHPLIWERVNRAQDDELGQWIMGGLTEHGWLPPRLQGFDPKHIQFLKNVSPHQDDPPAEHEEAIIARKALGNRNRWAVIAMDGNDIGRQWRAAKGLQLDAAGQGDWLRRMSDALQACTHLAFFEALSHVIGRWVSHLERLGENLDDYCVGNPKRLLLPFRPLVLGGDDITMLCHSAYAMDFVRVMAERFNASSAASTLEPRWPATQGQLTMSAGILYAKVSFPLHMAIPYAERLLADVKDALRKPPTSQKPSPAGVDWDTITDTLVEEPAARRKRELCFYDADLDVHVELTRRPYLLDAPQEDSCSLKALLALKQELRRTGLATSVLARMLPNLQRPWSERIAFLASIGKRHEWLMKYLWEDGLPLGPGWEEDESKKRRKTGFPDALLLLEEDHRMTQTTVED